MRVNEPITAVETAIPGDEPLVSRTRSKRQDHLRRQVFVGSAASPSTN